MSIKIISSSASKTRNENAQKRVLQRESETQKHFVSPKPETSLLLSDKTEFPSLSESLGRASNYLPSSRESLKYSDKLKLSSCKNHVPTSSNAHVKYNASVTDKHLHDNNISRSNFQNLNDKNKLETNSKPGISNQVSNNSRNKPVSLNNKKCPVGKNEIVKQKPVLKSKLSVQNVSTRSPVCSSGGANLPGSQSDKPVSSENNESKEENSTQESAKAKKKKKRKSKVKRQVALQSGKITFLTPEIHSKILNQASTLNVQNLTKNSVIGNINDAEEYPELGKISLHVNHKENFLKMNTNSEYRVETALKSINSSAESNVISENIINESPIVASEKSIAEKKDKNEKVHSLNPITISFYDMLLEKNIKKREMKELESKPEIPTFIGLSKLKNKKNTNHPHNLLDSSSPAVKRGKERENPKPKKPSQLKKIILLDRKARREHLLQMKSNDEEEIVTNENVLIAKPCEEGNEPATSEKEDELDNDFKNGLVLHEDDFKDIFNLSEDADFYVENELVSEMAHLTISDNIDDCNIVNNLSSTSEQVIEKNNILEKSTLNIPLNESMKIENGTNITPQTTNQFNIETTQVNLNILPTPGSILNSLTENIQSDTSDKEKAVKILLHTRNFREYCNHLISKDIDDAAYTLLDDLARFQDRLHQKDPVKARMKKRMIYGVKEVKKYIKLRKLKCIIIAVDIENVETQGGLNDILNEIKVSAVDHHIPCVFALSRKVLGKVCHKPVPVSCVGVFNYEGSEVNFKKMIELQSQSKTDYTEILNKLLIKVTDEEVAALIKAKREAPETLREIRTNILSNFFLLPNSVKSEHENVECEDDVSKLIDITT